VLLFTEIFVVTLSLLGFHLHTEGQAANIFTRF